MSLPICFSFIKSGIFPNILQFFTPMYPARIDKISKNIAVVFLYIDIIVHHTICIFIYFYIKEFRQNTYFMLYYIAIPNIAVTLDTCLIDLETIFCDIPHLIFEKQILAVRCKITEIQIHFFKVTQ